MGKLPKDVLEHPLVKRLLSEYTEDELADSHCVVLNAICPYRLEDYMCQFTRLERLLMMFDCDL